MSSYTTEDGTKYNFPASAIWKVGLPLAAVAVIVVLFLF
jgi:hypothetical protein